MKASQVARVRAWRQCEVRGCTRRADWTHNICANHRRHRRSYGKPTARRIKYTEWKPYHSLVIKLFRSPILQEALTAADALMAQLLTPGPEPPFKITGPVADRHQLWAELTRMANPRNAKVESNGRHRPRSEKGGTARQALEVAMAIWLLSWEQPAVLQDDVRLTKAMASAVFKLAKRHHRRPVAGALMLFGTAIRETFWPLVTWLERTIADQRKARNNAISRVPAYLHWRGKRPAWTRRVPLDRPQRLGSRGRPLGRPRLGIPPRPSASPTAPPQKSTTIPEVPITAISTDT